MKSFTFLVALAATTLSLAAADTATTAAKMIEAHVYTSASATLADGATLSTKQDGFDGTGYIQNRGVGASTEWAVNPFKDCGESELCPTADEFPGGIKAKFTFRYACGTGCTSSPRPMDVYVNGVQWPALNFPSTGAFDKWGFVSAEQPIEFLGDFIGAFSVKLVATTAKGPHIDSMSLTDVTMVTPAPTAAPTDPPTPAPTDFPECDGGEVCAAMANTGKCLPDCKAWTCDAAKGGACGDWMIANKFVVPSGVAYTAELKAGAEALCGCAGQDAGALACVGSPCNELLPAGTCTAECATWLCDAGASKMCLDYQVKAGLKTELEIAAGRNLCTAQVGQCAATGGGGAATQPTDAQKAAFCGCGVPCKIEFRTDTTAGSAARGLLSTLSCPDLKSLAASSVKPSIDIQAGMSCEFLLGELSVATALGLKISDAVTTQTATNVCKAATVVGLPTAAPTAAPTTAPTDAPTSADGGGKGTGGKGDGSGSEHDGHDHGAGGAPKTPKKPEAHDDHDGHDHGAPKTPEKTTEKPKTPKKTTEKSTEEIVVYVVMILIGLLMVGLGAGLYTGTLGGEEHERVGASFNGGGGGDVEAGVAVKRAAAYTENPMAAAPAKAEAKPAAASGSNAKKKKKKKKGTSA